MTIDVERPQKSDPVLLQTPLKLIGTSYKIAFNQRRTTHKSVYLITLVYHIFALVNELDLMMTLAVLRNFFAMSC